MTATAQGRPVIQCPTCNQMHADDVRFCPHDGTPLTETSAEQTLPTTAGDRPASVEIALPVVVGGRYRLEEKRGGGGMAKVYRAVDVTLEREVAVKLINQELRKEDEFDARFQREARIASQLADPHIVVVHDYGIDPEYGPFLVMEFLRGETLRERLYTAGPLPFKAGLQLGAQLLLALIHAHDRNIIHRDIKPDNVFLLNQSGVRLHLRVLDFGIARIFRRDEPANADTLTSPGAVLGTPRYMSPEQLAGRPLDARSDLYSAAMVIHEALTGQLPYVSGKKLCELCPEATPAMEAVLDHCLKPNPAERRVERPGGVPARAGAGQGQRRSAVAAGRPGETGDGPPEQRRPDPHGRRHRAQARPGYGARPSKGVRRLLIAVGAALALVGAAILLRTLTWQTPGPPASSGPESLLGVKIGDPQQDVVDKLDLVHGGPLKDPWQQAPPEYLGRILAPDVLGLNAADLERLDVRRTKDEKVCAVFLDEKLRGLTVQAPHAGETGRGVGVSSRELSVRARYGQEFMQNVVPGSADVLIRTYRGPGVGFEIRDDVVTGAALFPAVQALP